MKIFYRILSLLFLSAYLTSCSSNPVDTAPQDSNQVYESSLENSIDWSSFQYKIATDGHVEKIMNDFCSDNLLGRVVGTVQNKEAQEYIKNYFEKLSIEPFDTDYYISNSDGIIPLDQGTNNVAAVIKGNDSTKAVYITAHLDHVNGNDNKPLSGAIDNASGIAVLLETAHKLKVLTDETPIDMDIVFIAFNAEELGLIGSQNFYNKYYSNYTKSYNINIDCVALKDCSTLSMGNDDTTSENLYKAMKETFDNEGVIYDESLYATKNGRRYGTSDHAVIRQYGSPSLVLGDSEIMDVVHTEKDNIDNIDYSDLEKISDALSKFIITNNGNTFY